MPALTIPYSFTPFTKIYSADMNSNFTAISTLLNTTKLDDDNIQNQGITIPTKVKATGGAVGKFVLCTSSTGIALGPTAAPDAGQFVSYNGSEVVWADSSIQLLYDRLVGSAAQVTAGVATDSTIAAAITAASAGDTILILSSYSTTENVTISKRLNISGQGYDSFINGTVTFDSASDSSKLTNCRIAGDVTLQAGADMVLVDGVWLDSGADFLIDDTVTGEYVMGLQAS